MCWRVGSAPEARTQHPPGLNGTRRQAVATASLQQLGPGHHRSQLSHLMLTQGKARSVIASDIVPGPLSAAKVNAAIKQLEENGTLKALAEKYGFENVLKVTETIG